MNFSFENQGTITYLVYSLSDEDAVDTMSLGMLTNNRIPGLAPAIYTQMDASKFIKYNVSAKISVKQFFEGQVNKKRLLGVFNGIVDAMLSAEDYMIDTRMIMLDLDYIFADVSTCETVLVCLPIEGRGNNEDLSSFFKKIMFSTQFDQTENCDHVARIINYLNSTPIFSLVDFKAVLDSLNGQSSSSASVVTPVQPRPQTEQPVQQNPVQQPVKPISQPVQRPVAPTPPPQPVRPAPQPTPQPAPVQPIVQQPANVNIPIPQTPTPPPAPKAGSGEKQISMLTLLMHYNKENKALYDAQKAAKKAQKDMGAQAVPQASQPRKQPQPNTGFAIPGGNSQSGFAIPGQPGPAVVQPKQPPQIPDQKPTPAPQPVQQPAYQAPPAVSIPPQPAYVPPAAPVGSAASFGETTVLGGGQKIGETTVLSGAATEVQAQPHLIRTKNHERINLNKPVFRIGKEKSYVDYFVSDNTAVSRSHANIVSRDGQYFIVDTNSTNHTYINGGMIQSNVETPLSHGTKIRLANEEFEFKLY